MSDRSGQTLDHYRLESIIGHGNMADVYRATVLGLETTVAVKIIHPHLLDQPSLLERFKREAEVMASLRHPNIVRLSDFVSRPDVAYIVMEYLAGGTLERRLSQARAAGTKIAPDMAARWLASIAAAVDLAHERGLIHRDLKPANILFRESGEPVLTDFGLAFLIDRTRLSSSNSMTGTPIYLSPEQARGMPGDTRSDIYSLGVILYEILVGQTPFQGPTISVAMKHISEAPPSPRQLGRYLAPEVEGVMMRALAKNPVERYQSAGALALALNSAVRQSAKDDQSSPAGKPAAASPSALDRPTDFGRADLQRPTPVAVADATAPAQAPSARLPSGGRWLRPLLSGLAVLAVGAVLATWIFANYALAASPVHSTPLFAPGSQVRVTITGAVSTSVLRGCPAGFWIGVLGLATDGDTGEVLARQTCGDAWWYRVALPNEATGAWDGQGWINGAYLEPR